MQTLLILGGNPVYNAPADLDFAAALAKVETTIHLRALPRRDLAALRRGTCRRRTFWSRGATCGRGTGRTASCSR